MQSTLQFQYIVQSVPGPGHDPSDFEPTLAGCHCSKGNCCYEAAEGCHCTIFGSNYDDRGLLRREQFDKSLIECGFNCACGEEQCLNRRVQRGVCVPLRVTMTRGGKGYGVQCDVPLQAGQFVCCYEGEVIGCQEADRRLALLTPGQPNFIFCLREHGPSGLQITCVDPTNYGNLARFVNHSCQPNLTIVPVRYTTPLAHLALFANKDIAPGEELCYSYGALSGNEPVDKLKACLCGSGNCQKYLPLDSQCLL